MGSINIRARRQLVEKADHRVASDQVRKVLHMSVARRDTGKLFFTELGESVPFETDERTFLKRG